MHLAYVSNIALGASDLPVSSLYPSIWPMNSSQSIRPLSVGNVVSASIRLLRSNWKPYMVIAVKVMAWSLVPLIPSLLNVVLQIMVAANPSSSGSGGSAEGLKVFLTASRPLFFLLGIFCAAKAGTHGALIARLAFQELMGQPETPKEGWQQVRKRMWHFWLARFMAGLISGVATVVVMVLLFLILTFSVGLVMGWSGIGTGPSQGFLLVVGLVAILLFLLACLVPLWLEARFFVPELPVAVEQVSGSDSIVRSWSLSKGHAVRILTILLVGGLMTIPPFILAFVPGSLALLALIPQFQRGVSTETTAIFTIFGLFGLGGLFAIVAGLLTIPFWQTMRAVIYYDLRSRREGLGLELGER